MTFWLLSLLLLIPALLIFLLPVLRVRKHQAEEDRTALNVTMYEERIAELEAQHAEGVLSAEQLAQGRDEAGRDLLEDTRQVATGSQARLGVVLPLVAALLIPVAGIVLYQVFGELDKVEFTLANQEPPQTEEEAIARLQQMVEFQPDSAGDWFVLGRIHFNRGEFQQALVAFDRTILLAGRQPEVLSPWAQAQYFASGNQWTDRLQIAVDEVLQANPFDAGILGFVGIAAFESGNFEVALQAWGRLLNQMDPRDPSAHAVLTGIERAEEALARHGSPNPDAGKGPVLPPAPEQIAASERGVIRVQLSMSPQVQEQAGTDAVVFVFARAADSSQMPVAAQRLSVASLPANIRLSDADVLMPQMQLSGAGEVLVQASISLDGDASEPKWVSAALRATADSDGQLELVIDRVIE